MKNRYYFILITLCVICSSISLCYLYTQRVITRPQDKFKEYRKMVYLTRGRVRVDFDLPKDSYLLRIKHIIQENQPKDIFVNGEKMSPNIFQYVRRRGIIETSYIYLPKDGINTVMNHIDISFSQNRPPDIEIILSNYRKEINNDIYILFSDSTYLPSGKISFKTTVLIAVLISLLFVGMVYLLSKILSLNINRAFLYQMYSILPFLIFLIFLWIGLDLSRLYRVIITPSYFWTFGMISFFITEGSIVLKKLLQGYRLKEERVKSSKEINIDNITEREGLLIINPKVKDFFDKAFSWIKSREFSNKCTLLFMALLVMCAFLVILRLEPVAKQFANIAYLLLFVGVMIKFTKFIKEKRSSKEINIDNITEREGLLIINPKVKDFFDKAFSWIKSREFSNKCTLLFMALLVMCAFLVILRLEPVAKQFANIAYLLLFVGVMIKFTKFIKEKATPVREYTDTINERLTGRLRNCIDFCPEFRDKKILNIGCRNGWFEKFVAENGCREVVGIDTDKDILSSAQSEVRNPKVNFINLSALDLSSFTDNYFDLVTMFDVIEHLPRNTEEKTLAGIARILKNDGQLVISTPNAAFFSNLFDPAWYFGHRHYSKDTLVKFLLEYKFEIEKIEYGGGFYEVFYLMSLYIFKRLFRREMPFKHWLEDKTDQDFLDGKGWTNIFILARKA